MDDAHRVKIELDLDATELVKNAEKARLALQPNQFGQVSGVAPSQQPPLQKFGAVSGGLRPLFGSIAAYGSQPSYHGDIIASGTGLSPAHVAPPTARTGGLNAEEAYQQETQGYATPPARPTVATLESFLNWNKAKGPQPLASTPAPTPGGFGNVPGFTEEQIKAVGGTYSRPKDVVESLVPRDTPNYYDRIKAGGRLSAQVFIDSHGRIIDTGDINDHEPFVENLLGKKFADTEVRRGRTGEAENTQEGTILDAAAGKGLLRAVVTPNQVYAESRDKLNQNHLQALRSLMGAIRRTGVQPAFMGEHTAKNRGVGPGDGDLWGEDPDTIEKFEAQLRQRHRLVDPPQQGFGSVESPQSVASTPVPDYQSSIRQAIAQAHQELDTSKQQPIAQGVEGLEQLKTEARVRGQVVPARYRLGGGYPDEYRQPVSTFYEGLKQTDKLSEGQEVFDFDPAKVVATPEHAAQIGKVLRTIPGVEALKPFNIHVGKPDVEGVSGLYDPAQRLIQLSPSIFDPGTQQQQKRNLYNQKALGILPHHATDDVGASTIRHEVSHVIDEALGLSGWGGDRRTPDMINGGFLAEKPAVGAFQDLGGMTRPWNSRNKEDFRLDATGNQLEEPTGYAKLEYKEDADRRLKLATASGGSPAQLPFGTRPEMVAEVLEHQLAPESSRIKDIHPRLKDAARQSLTALKTYAKRSTDPQFRKAFYQGQIDFSGPEPINNNTAEVYEDQPNLQQQQIAAVKQSAREILPTLSTLEASAERFYHGSPVGYDAPYDVKRMHSHGELGPGVYGSMDPERANGYAEYRGEGSAPNVRAFTLPKDKSLFQLHNPNIDVLKESLEGVGAEQGDIEKAISAASDPPSPRKSYRVYSAIKLAAGRKEKTLQDEEKRVREAFLSTGHIGLSDERQSVVFPESAHLLQNAISKGPFTTFGSVAPRPLASMPTPDTGKPYIKAADAVAAIAAAGGIGGNGKVPPAPPSGTPAPEPDKEENKSVPLVSSEGLDILAGRNGAAEAKKAARVSNAEEKQRQQDYIAQQKAKDKADKAAANKPVINAAEAALQNAKAEATNVDYASGVLQPAEGDTGVADPERLTAQRYGSAAKQVKQQRRVIRSADADRRRIEAEYERMQREDERKVQREVAADAKKPVISSPFAELQNARIPAEQAVTEESDEAPAVSGRLYPARRQQEKIYQQAIRLAQRQKRFKPLEGPQGPGGPATLDDAGGAPPSTPAQRAQAAAGGSGSDSEREFGTFSRGTSNIIRGTAALLGFGFGISIVAGAGRLLHKVFTDLISVQADALQGTKNLTAAYGANAGPVSAFATSVSKGTTTGAGKFPLSEVQQVVAGFKPLGTDLALSNKQLEQLTVNAARLADIHNVPLTDVAAALGEQLRGSSAGADKLGLSLNDVQVAARYANGAFATTFQLLPETEKAAARLAVQTIEVGKQSAATAGQVDTLGRAQRGLGAAWEDLLKAFGTGPLDLAKQAVLDLTSSLGGLKTAIDKTPGLKPPEKSKQEPELDAQGRPLNTTNPAIRPFTPAVDLPVIGGLIRSIAANGSGPAKAAAQQLVDEGDAQKVTDDKRVVIQKARDRNIAAQEDASRRLTPPTVQGAHDRQVAANQTLQPSGPDAKEIAIAIKTTNRQKLPPGIDLVSAKEIADAAKTTARLEHPTRADVLAETPRSGYVPPAPPQPIKIVPADQADRAAAKGVSDAIANAAQHAQSLSDFWSRFTAESGLAQNRIQAIESAVSNISNLTPEQSIAAALNEAEAALLKRQTLAKATEQAGVKRKELVQKRDDSISDTERQGFQQQIDILDSLTGAYSVLIGAKQNYLKLQYEGVQLSGKEAQAQLGALPQNRAVQDIQLAMERNRLVAQDRTVAPDARANARRALRQEQIALPGAETRAFDANAPARGIQRQEEVNGFLSRIAAASEAQAQQNVDIQISIPVSVDSSGQVTSGPVVVAGGGSSGGKQNINVSIIDNSPSAVLTGNITQR